jgi:glycosyltransferase involved in cell wall biosynthesis
VVARHVLRALRGAGYEIDCLATNAAPDFPDPAAYPYRIVPAVGLPQDPFGARTFIRIVASARAYDLLLVQNDLQATHPAAGYLRALRDRGGRLPPLIYYFPIDCSVRRDLAGLLEIADVAVTCTLYGREEVRRTFPDRACAVIPHGVDCRAFRPLDERDAVRDRFRDVNGLPRNTLVACTVAANTIRKDLARALAAFAQLRAAVTAPTAFYLHTVPVTNGIDLNAAASACGLAVGRDVIFPRDYHPLRPVSDAAMNELYNASDVYFTTTLGEGWGLPVTEAMAAGLAVVAPRHTSLAELGGEERAVLYECPERIWVDNSGYRPLGLMRDIVAALARGLSLSGEARDRMTSAARAYTSALDWSIVGPRWAALADELRAAAPSQSPRAS